MSLVIGSTAMTIPIFMMPLVKPYGMGSRAFFTLPTVYLLMLRLIAPITGWLLN